MNANLRLGRVDEWVSLSEVDKQSFLARYHHPAGFAAEEVRFRDDSRNLWRDWEPIPGDRITQLTRALQRAGFMPHAVHDGVFGYVTQAAVRLFQEYVRSVDLAPPAPREGPACWPDGIVGRHTTYYLHEWRNTGRRCRWMDGPPTQDYLQWMGWLPEVAAYYREHPTGSMQHLVAADVRGDSLVPAEWQFSSDEPHLIGIRRHAAAPPDREGKRPPDDLFVLLINGRSFYFWGSTDANAAQGAEAYLLEGQHRYRFNWHNLGPNRRWRIYRAARPATAGVLVLRDVHDHGALTPENRRDGFDPDPNPTINIHWSGRGITNWSAGCQVIAGGAYINDLGEAVSCHAYTAHTEAQRGTKRDPQGPRLTMGAYTFLSDLLLCYTPPAPPTQKPVFRYTLLEENCLDIVPGMDKSDLHKRLTHLRTSNA